MTAIALTLVCTGLLGLLLALHPTFQICSESKYQHKGWLLLLAMILLFIIGYLGFIWMLMRHSVSLTEIVVAGIFCGGGGFVFIVTQISKMTIGELLELIEEKHFQALHDPLTGLPNRSYFYERLEYLVSHSQQVSCCMMMDINDFKRVNDTLGHSQGDHVLQVVAERIQIAVPADALAARIGGDEFTVLLPNTEAQAALTTAAEIQQALQQEIQCEDSSLTVGISIGIAQFPTHGEDRKILLKHSDIAMYQAKHLQGHIQIYSPFNTDPTRAGAVISSR